MKHLFCQSGVAFSSTSNQFRHLTSCQYFGCVQIACDDSQSLSDTCNTIYLSFIQCQRTGSNWIISNRQKELTQYNLFEVSAETPWFIVIMVKDFLKSNPVCDSIHDLHFWPVYLHSELSLYIEIIIVRGGVCHFRARFKLPTYAQKTKHIQMHICNPALLFTVHSASSQLKSIHQICGWHTFWT